MTNPGVAVITALETYDIRFPTSRELDGSDAMNPDPDYSAAYVVLRTDDASGLCGYGFVFTIGRGNDVQALACAALRSPSIIERISNIDPVIALIRRSDGLAEGMARL